MAPITKQKLRSRQLDYRWHKVAEAPAQDTSRAKQGSLLNANGSGQATFRDSAFGDNKSLPVHRWIPWIAGYSASFVDDVMSTYLPRRNNSLVLDPFCGVGTTLFQAALHGHDAIGFEINLYHYLRNTRPRLYGLSFITQPEQQRLLEEGNFSKYCQTVINVLRLTDVNCE